MTASPTAERDASRPSLLRWAWLPLFVAAFAPTLLWLWGRWTLSIWYNGHGIFMPFILAYLTWDLLRQERDTSPRTSALGFAFLVPGLAMLALDAAIHTQLMAAAGFVVCLPGLYLLLLGSGRTQRLLFPLLIAPLMLPIPAGFVSGLHMLLRTVTSIGIEQLLPWLSISVAREGTLLLLPTSSVRVADACSGFSTLYASVTTALILSHLVSSRRRRLALVLSCIPIAIATNIVRVLILTLLVHYGQADLLETSLHEGSGIVSFLFAVMLLFWIGGSESMQAPPGQGARVQPSTRYAWPMLAMCALALVPVGVNSYAQRRVDVCTHPEALLMGTGISDPALRDERDRLLRERFAAEEWREGSVPATGDRPRLDYTIIRTYDPKRAYYRPEWRLLKDEPFDKRVIEVDTEQGTIPVHVPVYAAQRGTQLVVAYLIVYQGEPVADPYINQLRSAASQMFSGASPMTLYIASARVPELQTDAALDAIGDWLGRSWKHHRNVCAARERPAL
jgi:exosortase